jgi:hypothetical protein
MGKVGVVPKRNTNLIDIMVYKVCLKIIDACEDILIGGMESVDAPFFLSFFLFVHASLSFMCNVPKKFRIRFSCLSSLNNKLCILPHFYVPISLFCQFLSAKASPQPIPSSHQVH